MQDLNDMLYFAEVVDRGGFAAAGRALGIPKSRLSRRVAELEARLGVRLLQRTTRKLSLTEAGELYHRHCSAMRDEAAAAAEAVALVQTEPRGTIRVSCPVTLAQTVLGELMPAFLARHPLVRVELQVSNRAVNLVEEGLDVALRVRPTVDDSGSMVVKRLDVARQVLVASPDLLIRQGTPTTLADLARMETVLWVTAEVLRVVGILTQPFIPLASEKLLDLLAVPADQRTFAHATPEFALTSGTTLPAPIALFPRYVEEEKEGEGA